MALISDILLVAGAFGAAFYCFVLSRRLARLNNLEDGVGAAVTGLTEQVSGMTDMLEKAQAAALTSSTSLEDSTKRAEAAARHLELLLASLHDLPQTAQEKAAQEKAAPSTGPTFRRAGPTLRFRGAAE